ncbi:Endonuclease IV [Paenibacillus sp. ov031]|uniref:deoxyribonuclease IV n=1 Tax=unclassified Paenibacillus TaxID=185978 RepID=UPI00088487EE|nr:MULTISPECIES: deoxyribonuclease IV [unclassified Paenibacillus]SDK19111.1 Endonuclease IV [Paenibacillus sp. OK060]SHN57815.1 Endonuclease IV [Paenibacillus sp. ov031]
MMKSSDLLIGSHVSFGGKEMLLQASKEAASYGASTFLMYTGAPQNSKRKSISQYNIEAGHLHMKQHGISNIVVHAPFLINLANSCKREVFDFSVQFLRDEIERTAALGSNQLVLHPGAHVNAGLDIGIRQIIRGLNEVLQDDNHPEVQISLETMAGKGTECGTSFEELAQIVDGVQRNERISICLDTCHVHDAGYDIVDNFDVVLEQFDKVLGLDRLKVLHINDSKNVRGSRKDRHENIGHGHIGLQTLDNIVHHPQLVSIPKLLETPSIGKIKYKSAPYRHEIALLRRECSEPVQKEEDSLENSK